MNVKEIIAMHGWGNDSSRWDSWQKEFKKDNWIWQNAERGYGNLTPAMPRWRKELNSDHHKRVLICHSLGSHLIEKEIIKQATHVVLLNSFSRFIPKGKENRSTKIAIEGMRQSFGTQKEISMIENFLKKAAMPNTASPISTNSIVNKINKEGREKLQGDLEILSKTIALPNGFPKRSVVLVVNAKNDYIVPKSTQAELINDLLKHLASPPTIWNINGAGHDLSGSEIIHKIKSWLN